MDNNDMIYINVDLENTKNKHYQPMGLVIAQDMKTYNYSTEQWEIKKTKLKSAITNQFKMSAKTAKKILDAFLESGLLQEGETKGTVVMSPAKKGSNNAVMYMDTARYCADNLSYDVFKTYCILFKHYKDHVDFGYKDYFQFSIKDLITWNGYGYDSDNIRKFEEQLMTLRRVGLIDYPVKEGTDIPYRPTKKDEEGKYQTDYIKLLKVNSYTDIQIQSLEETHNLLGTKEETVRKFQIDPNNHW